MTMTSRSEEPLGEVLARVRDERSTYAYGDSGEAQADGQYLANVVEELIAALWDVRIYQAGDAQRQQDVAHAVFLAHPDWTPGDWTPGPGDETLLARYRAALERIEREDHEGGPGWMSEIAAEALNAER
jgi:hypothetical protein